MAGTAPSRIVTERRYRLTSTFTFTTGSTKEPPKLCSVARTANKVYRGRAFEFLDACKIKRKPVIKLVLCGPHRTVLRCVWEGTQAVLNKLQEHLGKVVQSKEYHAAKRAFNVEIGFDPMESFLVTVVVEPVAVEQPGVAVRKRSSSPSLSEPLQAKRHRSSSPEEGDSVVPEGRPESDNVAAAGKFTTSPTLPPLDKETERSLFGASPTLGPQVPESNAEHSHAIPPTAPVAAARRTPLFLEDSSESENEKENEPIGSSGSASSPRKRGRSTTGSLINTDVSSRRPERSADPCALPYKTIKSRGRVSSLKITICGGAQEVKQESEPVTNALVAEPAEPSAFAFVKDEFAHVDVFGTGSLLSDSATPLATNIVPSLLCTAGNRGDRTLGEGSVAHSKPGVTLLSAEGSTVDMKIEIKRLSVALGERDDEVKRLQSELEDRDVAIRELERGRERVDFAQRMQLAERDREIEALRVQTRYNARCAAMLKEELVSIRLPRDTASRIPPPLSSLLPWESKETGLLSGSVADLDHVRRRSAGNSN